MLAEYAGGVKVLEHFQKNKSIESQHRSYICQALVLYYHNKLNRKMTSAELEHEADRIANLFNDSKVRYVLLKPWIAIAVMLLKIKMRWNNHIRNRIWKSK